MTGKGLTWNRFDVDVAPRLREICPVEINKSSVSRDSLAGMICLGVKSARGVEGVRNAGSDMENRRLAILDRPGRDELDCGSKSSCGAE